MRTVVVMALFAVAAAGQIKGIVVDQTGAAIPALIRVIETDSEAVVERMRADESGKFKTGFLIPGSYTVTAGAPGFRRRDITTIVVRNDQTIDLGNIKLDLAGCDAPRVSCDEFLSSDFVRKRAEARVTSGELRLKLGHVEPASESNHLLFTKDGAHVYLIAAKGAAMSIPNSSTADCGDAKFSEARIRVDGLGPGVDLCVRRKDGVVSHVFFTEDVERDSEEINLWYVTRR